MLTHSELSVHAVQRGQGGQWLPQELQARRDQLRKARIQLDHQIERVPAAYLAKVIEREEYTRRRQALTTRQEAVDSQVRQVEASGNRQQELAGTISSISAFCERVQAGLADATFEQKRQRVE